MIQLYISGLLSAILLIYYIVAKKLDLIILYFLFFIVLGNYTNELYVVLFFSFALTGLYDYVKSQQREGFEDGEDSTPPVKEAVRDYNPTEIEQAPVDQESSSSSDPPPPSEDKKPSPQPSDVKPSEKKSDVNYGATLSEAYSNLNNLVGKDGIDKLTNQTSTLLAQQNQLVKSMEGLAPLMKNAKSLIDTFQGLDLVNAKP